MIEPPWLVPIPIPTDTFLEKLKARFATRYFCLGRDWYYFSSDGMLCVIPAAFRADLSTLKDYYFISDGKSYPKVLRCFLSPLGIGLTEGLAHDFVYRYRCQILADGVVRKRNMTRKECDIELRDIGISVNGMNLLSHFSYAAVRVGGVGPWNDHRKNDGKHQNQVDRILLGFHPDFKLSQHPLAT